MAILSEGMKLSYKASGTTFTDLTNLQEVPELGGSVEKVDVTCLGDSCKKYINGLKDYGDIAFKFVYDKAQFSTLSALTGSKEWKVTIPDDASAPTTATFSGEPSVKLDGGTVNGALTYTLSIAVGSEIVFA